MGRSSARRYSLLALAALCLGLGLAGACGPAGSAPAGQAGSAPAGVPAARPPEIVQLRLHVPSRSTSYLPWYLAIEQGYFQEQNLAVELIQSPGTTGLAALIAGEVQFSANVSAGIPALAQGAGLKVIFIQSGKANYWFTTRPEINTLQDLKGKRVVVPNLGMSDAYTRLLAAALRKAGMDPLNDVIFIAGGSSGGGGSDILVGALVAGAADGMVGNVLQRLAAEAQGFHTIYSFADSPDLQGGVVTTDNMLRTRPDVVRRFLTAAVKGVRVMAEDPETSLDVLLRYVELDRGEAAKGLGYVRPLMSKDGLITPTEQRDGLEKLKEANPQIESLEVSQVFDFDPLQDAIRTVDASGWQPR